ncbi:hypothetical protein B0T16DRAFT_404384 [Cercophora newfieldiana]|uniref:Uncharacterized protein n=1 Tax=Cercophora newfieldiana TaxID=92897 RepID=A0AA40CU84_9PEZI|nr:hypothetical protein B0T16DRAFT_404384 [Cercophora newfieldiana]
MRARLSMATGSHNRLVEITRTPKARRAPLSSATSQKGSILAQKLGLNPSLAREEKPPLASITKATTAWGRLPVFKGCLTASSSHDLSTRGKKELLLMRWQHPKASEMHSMPLENE